MLADERFITGDYHTGTVEREMDLGPLARAAVRTAEAGRAEVADRRFEVELDGKRFAVHVREHLEHAVRPRKPKPPASAGAVGGGGSEALTAPMQGTIVKVLVSQGDRRSRPATSICVLEAMKMENSILAHTDGTVEELKVEAGAAVDTGATLAVIR